MVESTRLGRYSREPAPTLSSSPVALHIETPTPEWAAAEVARAVAALEGRGPGTAREGAAILRHLGTKDAALALVSHYGAGGRALRFDWTAGLVASPHRAEIVEAMEARVDAGEPLRAGFVRDLALLRSFLDLPGGSYAERFERQKAAECDYARRSLEALGRGSSHRRGARSRPGGARGAPRAAVRDEPPGAPRGSPGHGAGGLPGPPAADAGPAARAPLEQHRGALDPAGARGRLRRVARRLPLPRGGRRRAPSPRRDGPRAGPRAGDRRDPDRRSRARPRDADLAPRRVRPGPRRGPAAALSSRPHRGGPARRRWS